jgi:hypothetical protein
MLKEDLHTSRQDPPHVVILVDLKDTRHLVILLPLVSVNQTKKVFLSRTQKRHSRLMSTVVEAK